MVEHGPAALDAVFHALADPTRRAILQRLRQGEALVTEVSEPFDMSLAAVSKHIRALELAGLIRRQVVGREHRLSLDPTPLRKAASWIEYYREFWEARLNALDALLIERRSTSSTRRRKP